MKICTKCKVEQELSNFSKNVKCKEGYSTWCKKCVRENSRRWYEKNKENILAKQRELYLFDQEFKDRKNQHYLLHREEISKAHKQYYKKNKKTLSEKASLTRQTPKDRYREKKRDALRRHKIFELTFEEFMTFWQKPCFYCGEISLGGGIDRKDNTQGYFLDNCLPCCKLCNWGKYTGTQEEFVNRCFRVVLLHHQLKEEIKNLLITLD